MNPFQTDVYPGEGVLSRFKFKSAKLCAVNVNKCLTLF